MLICHAELSSKPPFARMLTQRSGTDVAVALPVGDGVGEGVGDGVAVTVSVAVGDGVAVGVGDAPRTTAGRK